MEILILGGTRFLGPALVDNALGRGHVVTLFNRGRTNPHLYPELEKLEGDRDPEVGDGLRALEGGTWDAVIDTSGYVPRHVRASARLLKDNVRQYVFISSISVYPLAVFEKIGVDESTPVATLEDESIEEVNASTYGALKALCEQAAEAAMPGRATRIRPGLIVGPRDNTDRFTYWPVRIHRGGEVLAPQPHDRAVQIIDVRDLAGWAITMIENGHAGTYNATGPASRLSMAEMLYGCRAAFSVDDIRFTWVDSQFLEQNQVQSWMELPLWTPAGQMPGFGAVSIEKAREMGLTFRPLANTARDTLEWHAGERKEGYDFGARPGLGGMRAERERELLEKWNARNNTESRVPHGG